MTAIIAGAITILSTGLGIIFWLIKNKQQDEIKREARIDEISIKLKADAQSMDIADIRNHLRELRRVRKR